MTITKRAYVKFHETYKQFIQNDHDCKDMHVWVEDGLARLRKARLLFLDKQTGALRRITCGGFVGKFLKSALKILHNTDVKTYVLCLDPIGARRDEKMATFMQRQKPVVSGAPEFLTMPPGQDRFFNLNTQMPGTMDLIFDTPRAKAELYEFITQYIQSADFKKLLPEGKSFILIGGVAIRRILLSHETFAVKKHIINLMPVETTQQQTLIRTELRFDTLSEGDVGVWHIVYALSPLNIVISSYDGDVLLIGFMQMRHVIETNPDRKVVFVTRRSEGSKPEDEKVAKEKEILKRVCVKAYEETLLTTGSIDEAYRISGGAIPSHVSILLSSTQETSLSSSSSSSSSSAPSSSSLMDDASSAVSSLLPVIPEAYLAAVKEDKVRAASTNISALKLYDSDDAEEAQEVSSSDASRKRPRNTPNWVMQYVDMVGIYQHIIKEAYSLVHEYATPLHNPAETYVVALMLSSDSHDYIQTKRISKNLGAHYIWEALKTYLRYIGDLVRVYRTSTHESCPYRTNIHHYVVDVEALQRLIYYAYKSKANDTINISKKNNTHAKVEAAREKSFTKAYAKNAPSENDLQTVAAQCVWTLQYWGNGVFPTYEVTNGLMTDDDGSSIYGFTKKGWAEDVVHARYRVAPPFFDETE